MQQGSYNLYFDEKDYIIKFKDEGFQGPINRFYYYYFDCEYKNQQTYIVIGISDLVLDLWGIKPPNDGLFAFCLQLMPIFISKLSNKKDNMTFIFHRDDNIGKKEDNLYFKASNSIKETAQSLLFSEGNVTNSQIRRQIISVCYSKWQTNPHGFVAKMDLIKFIPVEEIEIERNLKYLVDSGYLQGPLTSAGYIHVKITKYGIDIFENPQEFNKLFSINLEQQTINIGGDYIAPFVIGDKNNISINSQIDNSFNKIEEEIKNLNIQKKEDVLLEVKNLQKELKEVKPNPNKVSTFLEKIKKLGVNVNEIILKHPIIAQIIAELLLKIDLSKIKL